MNARPGEVHMVKDVIVIYRENEIMLIFKKFEALFFVSGKNNTSLSW